MLEHAEKRRLLVVDDDYMIATAIADILEDAGYDVAGPVRNVVEAMRIVGMDGVDGAVLDLELNGERTLAVAMALMKLRTPVLFVTGHAKEILTGDWAGAPHLEKPFASQELLDRVQRMLPRH